MASAIRNTVRMVLLLQEHPRITVRKIQDELGMSRSAVYRTLQTISRHITIRLDDGVVCVLEGSEE
ncbi:hypothetical protein DSCW_18430 [Desulfosarcina widdelii]|uniref:Helix-turn-helix type 11 domain-containing protein n=1 Tax=Desulfosarcina widdelii TaxID=947919 RepID=A0A5K7YYG8_9BACT|nr:HTH domain-containing protein [Desulfosarcina widdelii]BBO74426.1 hypothetical protein DSCW_18430 [Desulfosarcina widdelii]